MAIQDVDDLIKQFRQRPEWRDALRREILTEELLSLPQIVRDLAEAQRQTQIEVRELAEDQRRTQAQVDDLVTQMRELVTQMRELVEAQRRMDDRIGRLDGRVGSMDGRLFEREYVDKAVAYFDDLLRKIRVLSRSDVARLLDQAEERISQKERKQVLEADLILAGQRIPDKIETYLLGEVSVGIGLEDVHRAARRSRLLSQVTEKPVISAVGGKSILPEAQELAMELGVSIFLNGGLQEEG